MKKIFNIVFVLSILCCFTLKVQAMTFSEAFSQIDKKPMVVLIYAQWADNYQGCLQAFRTAKNQFGTTFNFVELDIATPEAKAFNNNYQIYPKLPYALMLRNGGKVSRYLQRDCASSYSCLTSKLKSFIL